MKKAISAVATAIIAATCMCGCAKTTTSDDSEARLARTTEPQQVQSQQNETDVPDEPNKIDIIIDGIKSRGFRGIHRHIMPNRNGKYVVEYIHTPYGIDKDETLDYNLWLNDDNTFSLTVVSDGVTAEHNGHWYERRNNIMLFYDEPMDETQHNVYIADSLFCDVLPNGKIMIYDNCHTIVLTQAQQDDNVQQNL